jgi:hypothetical protein
MSDSVLKVNPAQPFDCVFEKRKKFGEYLVHFIEKAGDNERTVCIDAGWGYGKTTFLNSLAQALQNNGHAVFRYNAWENDYAQDALTSLVRELLPQMIEYCKGEVKEAEAVANILASFLAGGNAIVKFFTDIDILSGVKELSTNKETIKKFLTQKNGKDVQTLQEVDSLTKLKKDFTDSLVRFQKQFSHGKKIVILVDELDRCRPSYALEVLERIKHFFDVPNYLFVFAVNKKPLEEIIKKTYGDGDTEGYFRRFFDYELYLPEPNREQFIKIKEAELNNRFPKRQNYITTSLKLLEKQNISLRDCEKACIFLESCLIGMPDSIDNEITFYFSLGIIFYIQEIQLFRKYYIDHVDLDGGDIKILNRYNSLFTIKREREVQTFSLGNILVLLHRAQNDKNPLHRTRRSYINVAFTNENSVINSMYFETYLVTISGKEGEFIFQDKDKIAICDQLFAFTSSVVTPQEGQS